jgi:hypothetical protein
MNWATIPLLSISKLMKPEFRPFERNDTKAVATLLRAVLPDEQSHNEPSAVLELKTRTDNLCLVATMDSTICGFVMGGFDGPRQVVIPTCRGPKK